MEMLHRLRGSQNLTVMILFAVDAAAERVAALRAGADDYLCKRFDFTALLIRMVTQRLG